MSKQYDEYLEGHIAAVRQAGKWMLDNLPSLEDLEQGDILEFCANIATHDASKRCEEEYGPYDAYFYGEKDEDAFNRAWLHHIHNNKHHWQHWLLVNDDGKFGDGSKIVALEMVADWWSFSWRSGNLEEVFDWYEEHKDGIILHPDTRAFVESVLDEIREKVSGE